MSRMNTIREALIRELIDVGEILPTQLEDIFEDMGGHLVHESDLDGYINEYIKQLSLEERAELIERTSLSNETRAYMNKQTPEPNEAD